MSSEKHETPDISKFPAPVRAVYDLVHDCLVPLGEHKVLAEVRDALAVVADNMGDSALATVDEAINLIDRYREANQNNLPLQKYANQIRRRLVLLKGNPRSDVARKLEESCGPYTEGDPVLLAEALMKSKGVQVDCVSPIRWFCYRCNTSSWAPHRYLHKNRTWNSTCGDEGFFPSKEEAVFTWLELELDSDSCLYNPQQDGDGERGHKTAYRSRVEYLLKLLQPKLDREQVEDHLEQSSQVRAEWLSEKEKLTSGKPEQSGSCATDLATALIGGLQDLVNNLKKGIPLEDKYTVREIPTPTEKDPSPNDHDKADLQK